MMFRLFMPAFLALVSISAMPLSTMPAHAQEHPPVMDEVVLSLSDEAWVATTSARVVVSVNAAMPGRDAGAVRDEMLGALDNLQDAEWRFTGFERSRDSAGLERWSATLEARIREDRLGGLSDRARDASRPGLQMSINEVDFSPTLAEVEAVRAGLRESIYRQIAAELERLNGVYTDRSFRIGSISFDGMRPAPKRMPVMRAEMMAVDTAASSFAPGSVAVSEKVVMGATVVFSALAPGQ